MRIAVLSMSVGYASAFLLGFSDLFVETKINLPKEIPTASPLSLYEMFMVTDRNR